MRKTETKKLKRKIFYKLALLGVFLFFLMGTWNVNFDLNANGKSFNQKESILVFKYNKASAYAWYDFLHLGPSDEEAAKHPSLLLKATTKTLSGIGSGLLWVFNWLLYAVWWLLAWFLGIAGVLFDWAIDANNLKTIIHREGIYEAWKIVRDFLNLGFILVLLFSAFATVFQIEKYHLKKILLMLVLMALLVNFSFPISRFVVDSSNMTMYYLLQQRFPDNSRVDSFSARFMEYTRITKQYVADDGSMASADYTKKILSAIVFTFILLITLVALAAILVIRIFALALIIIFSPIGFVAAILPDTKSTADKWWNNLFKYSFVGPTMIFMLIIAFRLMDEMQDQTNSALANLMSQVSNYEPGTKPTGLADAAYFFLPITLLWASILTAQSMGVAGASLVVSWAKRMQSKAARGVSRGAAKLAYAPVKATGVPGGVKERFTSLKQSWDSKRQSREKRVAALLGDQSAIQRDTVRRANEYDKDNITNDELKLKAQKGDKAAAYLLAKKGKMDDETYEAIQTKIKDKKSLELINGEIREKRIDLVINYRTNNAQELNRTKEKIAQETGKEITDINNDEAQEYIIKEETSNMSAETFANQDWQAVKVGINKIARRNSQLAQKIKDEVRDAYRGMTREAKAETRKRLNPNQTRTLNSRDFGLNLPV